MAIKTRPLLLVFLCSIIVLVSALVDEQQVTLNPYVFEDQHFTQTLGNEHGRVRILQKFNERSNLLRGIENYRLGTVELNPQTFLLPHHLDSEAVIFIAHGRGSITFVRDDKRKTYNVEGGDILRIPAGTPTYWVNTDNNDKLVAINLYKPVAVPGHFEAIFGAGGENPESFFRTFSPELLEAAFNIRRDKLERVFGEQKQGIIVKATEEQIRELSDEEGGSGGGPVNLFKKHPTHGNQHGRLHHVNANDYKELLDLDIAISFVNLTKGSMVLPIYSTKATKISMVIGGEGYLEIVSPRSSSETGSEGSQQGTTPRYQKLSTPQKVGMVLIAPPDYPLISVASPNQNLEIVGFEVNARDNYRFGFAGKKNVINHFKNAAKELAFGVPVKEVDEIFNSQKDQYFTKGPRQQQPPRGRAFI